MQFFLTDLALGVGAILAYLTYELLAARRTFAISVEGGGGEPGFSGAVPQRARTKPPRAPSGRSARVTPPAEFMILDPKRLARLW